MNKNDFLNMCKLIQTGDPLTEAYTCNMLSVLEEYVKSLSKLLNSQLDQKALAELHELNERIAYIKASATAREFVSHFNGAGTTANAVRNYLTMAAALHKEPPNSDKIQAELNKFNYKIEDFETNKLKMRHLINYIQSINLQKFIPKDCYQTIPFQYNRDGFYAQSMATQSELNGELITEIILTTKLTNGVTVVFSYYINKPDWNEYKLWYLHPYENRWLLATPGLGLVGAVEALTSEYCRLLSSFVEETFDYEAAKATLDSLAEYVFMKSTGMQKQIFFNDPCTGKMDVNTISLTSLEAETVIRIPIKNSEMTNAKSTGYVVTYARSNGEYSNISSFISYKGSGGEFDTSVPVEQLTPLSKKVIVNETEVVLNHLITVLSQKEFASKNKIEITIH